MQKNSLINTLIIAVCITTLAVVIWDKLSAGSAFKYVIIKEVYDGFEMKKEYETRFKKVQTLRSKTLDSLEIELKIMSQQLELSKIADKELLVKFQVKREEYLNKKQQFAEDDAATVRDYDEKILKQLNQYIEDYGKQKNYEYILGYTGNGEVLYGKTENNITEEIIKFVNSKYSGH